jgi:hypothetical protein
VYHSITFGDKNTWDDWHLIPTSRPVFSPPPVKIKFVDVPGINGKLDLLHELIGENTYGNRTGSFQFVVANDYWGWDTAYSTIMNYLHGQTLNATLEDEPGYYYTGLFSVSEWLSNKEFSVITINYNVQPDKIAV